MKRKFKEELKRNWTTDENQDCNPHLTFENLHYLKDKLIVPQLLDIVVEYCKCEHAFQLDLKYLLQSVNLRSFSPKYSTSRNQNNRNHRGRNNRSRNKKNEDEESSDHLDYEDSWQESLKCIVNQDGLILHTDKGGITRAYFGSYQENAHWDSIDLTELVSVLLKEINIYCMTFDEYVNLRPFEIDYLNEKNEKNEKDEKKTKENEIKRENEMFFGNLNSLMDTHPHLKMEGQLPAVWPDREYYSESETPLINLAMQNSINEYHRIVVQPDYYLKFGKYKNTNINEVSRHYLVWLSGLDVNKRNEAWSYVNSNHPEIVKLTRQLVKKKKMCIQCLKKIPNNQFQYLSFLCFYCLHS